MLYRAVEGLAREESHRHCKGKYGHGQNQKSVKNIFTAALRHASCAARQSVEILMAHDRRGRVADR